MMSCPSPGQTDRCRYRFPFQPVIAPPAAQQIIPGQTRKSIVPRLTVQRIVAAVPGQHVIPASGVDLTPLPKGLQTLRRLCSRQQHRLHCGLVPYRAVGKDNLLYCMA
jgi:hypothetical protein